MAFSVVNITHPNYLMFTRTTIKSSKTSGDDVGCQGEVPDEPCHPTSGVFLN